MSWVTQNGSRWEVAEAFYRTLQVNLQGQMDQESDLLTKRLGESEFTPGAGAGVRLPDLITVDMAMEPEIIFQTVQAPVVVVGGQGTTRYVDAQGTINGMAQAQTMVTVHGYLTTRVILQGQEYRYTERELVLALGAFSQAIVSTLRANGISSLWQQKAGIVIPQVVGVEMAGHSSNQTQLDSAKTVVSWLVSHESRY